MEASANFFDPTDIFERSLMLENSTVIPHTLDAFLSAECDFGWLVDAAVDGGRLDYDDGEHAKRSFREFMLSGN